MDYGGLHGYLLELFIIKKMSWNNYTRWQKLKFHIETTMQMAYIFPFAVWELKIKPVWRKINKSIKRENRK